MGGSVLHARYGPGERVALLTRYTAGLYSCYGSGKPAALLASYRPVLCRCYGSGEPAAPRPQSLLRSQARCALLTGATPRDELCRHRVVWDD
jgi:hypothetical protein